MKQLIYLAFMFLLTCWGCNHTQQPVQVKAEEVRPMIMHSGWFQFTKQFIEKHPGLSEPVLDAYSKEFKNLVGDNENCITGIPFRYDGLQSVNNGRHILRFKFDVRSFPSIDSSTANNPALNRLHTKLYLFASATPTLLKDIEQQNNYYLKLSHLQLSPIKASLADSSTLNCGTLTATLLSYTDAPQ